MEIIGALIVTIFLFLIIFERHIQTHENNPEKIESVILLKPLFILIDNPSYWLEKQNLKNVNVEIYSKILDFSLYAAKQRAISKKQAYDMVLYMMNVYMLKKGFETKPDYEFLADIADDYTLRK